MRDLIYELSDGQSQIIATTHSPYLIDLSRKPRQVLNRFHYDNSHTTVYPLSVTEKFLALQDNDKDQIKMLIKLDDHVSRIFFTRKVVVVEGDTEEVIIKEAIRRMPKAMRNKLLASTELVKARGKAAIIGLVKYLSALDVDFLLSMIVMAELPVRRALMRRLLLLLGMPAKLSCWKSVLRICWGIQLQVVKNRLRRIRKHSAGEITGMTCLNH